MTNMWLISKIHKTPFVSVSAVTQQSRRHIDISERWRATQGRFSLGRRFHPSLQPSRCRQNVPVTGFCGCGLPQTHGVVV